MITSLIGKKLKQRQMMSENGKLLPVTDMLIGPCTVVQVKTHEKDGYSAVQLGFGTKKERSITKPLQGHMIKTGKAEKLFSRFLKEIRMPTVDTDEKLTPGSVIHLSDVFEVGNDVMVTGTSKGKGFAGVVKRHGFAGGPKTHGQSDRHRAPGSIGSGTTPGRVYKGKRMAGRMGGERVTIKGLSIVALDTERNIVTVKGLVPGHKGSLVFVSKE